MPKTSTVRKPVEEEKKVIKEPTQTPEIRLLKKLAKFQKKLITIKKDAKNPFFKSKYATLEGILVAITPSLNEVGLVITHSLSELSVETSVIDYDSGQSINSSFPVFGTKPQEIGSSITYARRYNIGALLNLNIDNDDDGNSANSAKKITGEKCPKCSKEMVIGKDGKTYYCVECWKQNKKLEDEKAEQLQSEVSDPSTETQPSKMKKRVWSK